MGNDPSCRCRCLGEDLSSEADLVPVYPCHESWVRSKDGLIEKKGNGATTPGDAEEFKTKAEIDAGVEPIGTFRSNGLEDDYDSDSEKSAGGFVPRFTPPSTPGRVSPVPKLVLPKRVFKDHSANGLSRNPA